MCEITIDPRKLVDRRKHKTCIQCRKRKCEDEEDEFCQMCWQVWREWIWNKNNMKTHRTKITIEISGPDANTVAAWRDRLDKVIGDTSEKLIENSTANTLIKRQTQAVASDS